MSRENKRAKRKARVAAKIAANPPLQKIRPTEPMYQLYRRVNKDTPWRLINNSDDESTIRHIHKDWAPKRFPGQELVFIKGVEALPE